MSRGKVKVAIREEFEIKLDCFISVGTMNRLIHLFSSFKNTRTSIIVRDFEKHKTEFYKFSFEKVEVKNAGCTGKIRYRTPGHARKAKKQINRETSIKIEQSYYCNNCLGYHLSSKKQAHNDNSMIALIPK